MRALFLAKIVFTFLMIFNFSAVSISAEVIRVKNQADVENLAETVGKNPGSNPWHFSNLYDETTNSFFIPYHLWSGSKWDGDKTAKNCLGEVKNTWKFLNARNKQVKSQVSGPISFTHPISGINFKTYEWKSKRGSQHLICHEKGMARIYDFRFDEAGLLDSPILNGKECKFPAGFGWQIAVPQDCNPLAPKQTTLIELIFDDGFNLSKIAYTYTEKEGFNAVAADDYYEYEVEKGRVLHKKLQ